MKSFSSRTNQETREHDPTQSVLIEYCNKKRIGRSWHELVIDLKETMVYLHDLDQPISVHAFTAVHKDISQEGLDSIHMCDICIQDWCYV